MGRSYSVEPGAAAFQLPGDQHRFPLCQSTPQSRGVSEERNWKPLSPASTKIKGAAWDDLFLLTDNRKITLPSVWAHWNQNVLSLLAVQAQCLLLWLRLIPEIAVINCLGVKSWIRILGLRGFKERESGAGVLGGGTEEAARPTVCKHVSPQLGKSCSQKTSLWGWRVGRMHFSHCDAFCTFREEIEIGKYAGQIDRISWKHAGLFSYTWSETTHLPICYDIAKKICNYYKYFKWEKSSYKGISIWSNFCLKAHVDLYSSFD